MNAKRRRGATDEQATLTIHFSDTATPEQKARIIAAFEALIAALTPLLTAPDPSAP